MSGLQLLVFTQSYPYGNKTDFMEDEIHALADAFDVVTLVPTEPRGAAQEVPDTVVVDESLAPRLTRAGRARGMFSRVGLRLLAAEVRSNWRKLVDPRLAVRAMLSAGGAAAVADWWSRRADGGVDIVYSYWLTEAVVGVRVADPSARIVSRVHRGDLFTEFRPGGYIPQHERSIAACDQVASVSRTGLDYLVDKYGEYASRLTVRRLGVVGFGRSERSSDGVIRVVTCSSLTDVKRPTLAARSICALAEQRPVVWDHFGDGPLKEAVLATIEAELADDARLDHTFHGHVDSSVVASHFSTQPVDLLLNTSSSEGVPVSMMEALSASVPVVATDAGGSAEIVEPGNGRPLRRDATPDEIATAIAEVADDPGDPAQRLAYWSEHYDARVNDVAFAEWLVEIATSDRDVAPERDGEAR